MALTECPRCVAERRARRAGAAERSSAKAALGAFGAFWLAILTDVQGPWPVDGELVYSTALLSLASACASLASSALVRRFTRRATTPLPAPEADPLATYREGGPPECPRHPFAQ
jgi:hypothetical protein